MLCGKSIEKQKRTDLHSRILICKVLSKQDQPPKASLSLESQHPHPVREASQNTSISAKKGVRGREGSVSPTEDHQERSTQASAEGRTDFS